MTPLCSWKKSCLFPCSVHPHLRHQRSSRSLPNTHWWLHAWAHRIHITSHHHPGWPQSLCAWLIQPLFPQSLDNLRWPWSSLSSTTVTQGEMFKFKGPDCSHSHSSFQLSLACPHHTCSWTFSSPLTSSLLYFLPTHHSDPIFPFTSFPVRPCELSLLTTVFLYSQWPCLLMLLLHPPGKVPNQG